MWEDDFRSGEVISHEKMNRKFDEIKNLLNNLNDKITTD